MEAERIPADELPATTKALAEVLARSVGLDGAAVTRIEVGFNEKGVVLELWRHHKYPASELGRFDLEPGQLAELLRERIAYYREG